MTAHFWDITLDRAMDDLGTSLMPDELHIADNAVVFITGSDTARTIRLAKPVKSLAPDDIAVKRSLAELSGEPSLKVVGVKLHEGPYSQDAPPW